MRFVITMAAWEIEMVWYGTPHKFHTKLKMSSQFDMKMSTPILYCEIHVLVADIVSNVRRFYNVESLRYKGLNTILLTPYSLLATFRIFLCVTPDGFTCQCGKTFGGKAHDRHRRV